MNPDKIINVKISKDKKIELETENYKGVSCVEDIKELLLDFLEDINFDLKSDYYEDDNKLNIYENVGETNEY